jgi:D-amino-acid dehydrogenase
MTRSATPTSDECVIVGGGLVGWSIAWALVRRGRAVMVVEGEIAGSATDAGAGMITPGSVPRQTPGYLELARAAMVHYPALIAELESLGSGRTGFARPGGLLLARDETDLEWLDQVEQVLVERRAAGLGMIGDIQRISGHSARAMVPPLGDHFKHAVWYSEGARVSGRDLRSALRAVSLNHGAAEIIAHSRLVRRGDLVSVQIADGTTVDSGPVVIAAGAWSTPLLALVGIDLPIVAQRGQLIRLGWPNAASETWPIVELPTHHYLIGFPDGRVVCGATREDDSAFSADPTPSGLRELLSVALEIAPALGASPLLEVRAGLRPLSPDGLPLIGPIPGVANGWICAGHGPLGLTLGPYSGELLADLIERVEPAIDPKPYAAGRFQI